MVIIAHTFSMTIPSPSPRLLYEYVMNLPIVVPWVVSIMRLPGISHNALVHAFSFVAELVTHHSVHVEGMSDAADAMVGSIHSSEVSIRCSALAAIYSRNMGEAEQFQPYYAPRTRCQPPEEAMAALCAYGLSNTYLVRHAMTRSDFLKAIEENTESRGQDLCGLGETLVDLVLCNEDSMPDERTGEMEGVDRKLPWKEYPNTLLVCATALRARNGPGDITNVFILEIAREQMKPGREYDSEVIRLAEAALEHNPDIPYFYCALTTVDVTDKALRTAKKGLRCQM